MWCDGLEDVMRNVSEFELCRALYYHQLYTEIHCSVVWRPSLLPLLVFLALITLLHIIYLPLFTPHLCIRHRNQGWKMKMLCVPILMSRITILGWSSFVLRSRPMVGVVTFPAITTTRWRADVNRKEYQRRAIRKSGNLQPNVSYKSGVWRENISGQICPLFSDSVNSQSRSHTQCDQSPSSRQLTIMEVKIILLLFCHLPSSQSQLQPSFSPLSFLGNIWSTVSRARTLNIFQPQLRSKFLTDDLNTGDANVSRICNLSAQF